MKRLPLALAAIIAVAAGAFYFFRPHSLGDGPLTAGAGGTSSGQRLAIGERVSYGYVLLLNTAKKPASLENVRILGTTGGLEVLGIRSRSVPDEAGRGMFISLGGYPPNEWTSTPLETNHTVPVGKTFNEDGTPNEGLELVIGVRATQPGVGPRGRWSSPTRWVGAATARSTTVRCICVPQPRISLPTPARATPKASSMT